MTGNVLPTNRSLAVDAAYADRVARDKRKVADVKLGDCEQRIVGGEVRYYKMTDQYAIVNRQGRVLWFVVKDDGDYRILRK